MHTERRRRHTHFRHGSQRREQEDKRKRVRGDHSDAVVVVVVVVVVGFLFLALTCFSATCAGALAIVISTCFRSSLLIVKAVVVVVALLTLYNVTTPALLPERQPDSSQLQSVARQVSCLCLLSFSSPLFGCSFSFNNPRSPSGSM